MFYKCFRWLNYLIALFGGYFWLPCPRCGKKFGGHEWIYPNQSLGNSGICIPCLRECEKNGEIEADIQKTVKAFQDWHMTHPTPKEEFPKE